ncbi:hypothetical protein PV05_04796 [Exophiala xenobiotica]|uniref:Uncharacterized protein n=1 Tax=Exophiala xenobiotica TaxID=348802 RepID=A0A0D2EKZ8_9EURO|nr:uncharacterized protein PV05_04796 [Exophiala xenobiotica]KIW56113.1 hypothetical protein PV05_04796 [Exophiala xenobiotica]
MSDDPESESKGEGVAQSQYKTPNTMTAVTKPEPAVVASAVRKDEAEARVEERGIAGTDIEDLYLYSSSSAGRGSDRWEVDSWDPNYTAGDYTVTCCKCAVM